MAVPFCPLGGGVPRQRLGRSRLRVYDLLYDYTVTTIRHNLAMNAFCIRLYRWDKSGKMALVAAMPKLLPHPQRGNPGPCLLATEFGANGQRDLTSNAVAEQLP